MLYSFVQENLFLELSPYLSQHFSWNVCRGILQNITKKAKIFQSNFTQITCTSCNLLNVQVVNYFQSFKICKYFQISRTVYKETFSENPKFCNFHQKRRSRQSAILIYCYSRQTNYIISFYLAHRSSCRLKIFFHDESCSYILQHVQNIY